VDQAVDPVISVRDEIARATQDAVDFVGGISQIDTTSSMYLEPLKAFNTVASTIANVIYHIFLGVTSRLNLFTDPPLHSDSIRASHQCRSGAPPGRQRHPSHIILR